jgi:hypothetical protein
VDFAPFSDECRVFMQASERGASRLKDLLLTYQNGSGQIVNMSKSAIFFSGNCDDSVKNIVKKSMDINTEALGEKYLGLPTVIGRSSKEAFEPIPGKIRGLMNGWGEKLLSCAARETLNKDVAQSIPTYSMSCFLLAPDTCKRITLTISNYWWRSAVDSRGLHWKKWTDLTLPKSHGGMSFRDIKKFNLAMLGIQGCRLMTNPSYLCARVMKEKYYPNGDFMAATKKKNASHTWRAILMGGSILKTDLV